jgi:hypothetical protein
MKRRFGLTDVKRLWDITRKSYILFTQLCKDRLLYMGLHPPSAPFTRKKEMAKYA